MNWEGNDQVFRGYVKGNPDGDGKSPASKVKGKNLQKWSAVEHDPCFGAILNEGYVDISFDSDELSQKFWDMAEKNNWNCLILENQKNGHIHSFWKDSGKRIEKGGKDKKLAVGLVADIHNGSTYIPLRVHGVDRFPPCFEPDTIDEVPDELIPVNTQIDLLNLSEGQGRNDELFKYILILQSQLLLSKEDIRRVLQNTNDFVFSEPLNQDELEVICRDEAFEKPVFYNGKVFLHDAFGRYMKNEFHIKRINGQLHVYDQGIYKSGYRFIENKMIELIPALKANSRTEVLKFLEIITPEETYTSDANLIAFRNGVYDLSTDQLMTFSPEYIITNMIPWDYNPSAYSELCDKTLNKIACQDAEIRSLLEEAIGYCFFRQNELSKSFLMVGSGSNGKSTFLDMVKNVVSRQNYVALDIGELSERFSTSSMFGKLACFGDDSDDSFLEGKAIAQFKKIVSGNDLKGENKGQDVFFFKPYTKLFFSFNELPRMRNKGFFAIKRRLVIIPFNATFSKEDPDFDSGITWKLKKQDVAEYLVQLGIQGLKRVLANQAFTESQKVNDEVETFEKDNNPLLLFLDEVEEEEILNHETKEVFARYDLFCHENGFQKMAMQTFTKQINKILGCDRKDVRINGKKVIVFKKGKLVIITVGDDSSSKVYVKGKIKDCEYCGIPVEHIQIEDNKDADARLMFTIHKCNIDRAVAGIILQLPLPKHLNPNIYSSMINPLKDVDGLGSDEYFKPCTPKGIVHLMKKELGDLTGKDVLIIGRSNLVGKPLAKMLTDEDCTVTLAHSKTKNLSKHMETADVVVSAVGKAKEFDLGHCWFAEMVVDVGINRDEDNKLCGDFFGFDEFDSIFMKVTPVPKGVGLLTRAMLMKNVAEASERMGF